MSFLFLWFPPKVWTQSYPSQLKDYCDSFFVCSLCSLAWWFLIVCPVEYHWEHWLWVCWSLFGCALGVVAYQSVSRFCVVFCHQTFTSIASYCCYSPCAADLAKAKYFQRTVSLITWSLSNLELYPTLIFDHPWACKARWSYQDLLYGSFWKLTPIKEFLSL